MAKQIYGFNSEDDFDRMSRSVRKSESMQQSGQRQRAAYPKGSAGPVVKRGVISELGDYDIHKVMLLSGQFDEDLTTDSLEHTYRETEAYVASEFDYHLEPGDIVLLAKIGNRHWIIDAEPDCNGYCIDENHTNSYVYGWSFRAPSLPCCPEASGVHILTTSDSGVTYESSTFQCNSDGTDRKWLFNDRKLRLTPRLDEGNIEYWTDNAPASCTVQLQNYEPQLFPSSDTSCGRMPNSVCLNPMCGVGTCSYCSNDLSPMQYTVIIGEGGKKNPDRPSITACEDCAGTYIVKRKFQSSDSDKCLWIATENNGEDIVLEIASDGGTDYFSITCGSTIRQWWIATPQNCSESMTLDLQDSIESPPYCINFPSQVTIIPNNDLNLEGQCYPTTVAGLSASGTPVCSELPYFLEFELTGLSDGTCNQCSMLNDTHRVHLTNYTSAAWEGDTIAGNCLSSYTTTPYFFTQKTSTTLYLRFGAAGFASVQYSMAIADFNCFGPNVFSKDSADGECTGWPSTLTTYPMVSTI